jgi:hypothetical protein
VAAAALLARSPAPACPACRGGGEINGLPCRDCQGTTRAVRLPRWKALAGRMAGPAGVVVGRALNWSRSVPGIGGAASVTAGLSVAAHAAWRWLPVYAVALAVGGVFGLLADRRL